MKGVTIEVVRFRVSAVQELGLQQSWLRKRLTIRRIHSDSLSRPGNKVKERGGKARGSDEKKRG